VSSHAVRRARHSQNAWARHVETSLSSHAVRQARHVERVESCCDVWRRDQPSGIWALLQCLGRLWLPPSKGRSMSINLENLSVCYCSCLTCCYVLISSVFFNLFVQTVPFGAFRLLSEPDEVTLWFVLLQMDENVIFLHLVIHKKTPINTGVCAITL